MFIIGNPFILSPGSRASVGAYLFSGETFGQHSWPLGVAMSRKIWMRRVRADQRKRRESDTAPTTEVREQRATSEIYDGKREISSFKPFRWLPVTLSSFRASREAFDLALQLGLC